MAYQQKQPSSTKVERKIIEKNRRNQMKEDLCFKLNSLLPNFNPREVPRAEQIDEAIKYIESLEAKVKMAKEKKESLLMGRKRSRGCSCSSAFEAQGSIKPPTIDVYEVGNTLEIILTSGVDSQFIFKEIIRILHEENIEVLSANSSLVGDSMIHVVHSEIRHFFQLGAAKVGERLKRFVNGHWQDLQGA